MLNRQLRKTKTTAFVGSGLLFLWLLIFTLGLCLFLSLSLWPKRIDGVGLLLMAGELGQVLSPYRGIIDSWTVEEGDTIHRADLVASVRLHDDLDQSVSIKAMVDGVIAEILAYPNTAVERGQALALVTKPGDARHDLELIGFVSSLSGKKLRPGMTAQVFPSISNSLLDGYLMATVKRVGKLPISLAQIQAIVKIPQMAEYIRTQLDAEPFMVVLSLVKDEKSRTGYRFSGPGPAFSLDSGIFATLSIVYEEPRLIELLWPHDR